MNAVAHATGAASSSFNFLILIPQDAMRVDAAALPLLPSSCRVFSCFSFIRRQKSSAAYLPPTAHILKQPLCSSTTFHSARGRLTGRALLHDAAATTVVFAGAHVLVQIFDDLTRKEIINQKLSRKLVHIISGLIFALSWPAFSTSPEARYFASLVPLAKLLRLLTTGLSITTDEGFVQSVTRQGLPEELLRGPLYYVLILILCTTMFWRDSPVGLISLAMMCGGDGIADIMGRRFGSIKLPFNKQKSWAGSISMFAFGFLISIGLLQIYSALGYFDLDWNITMQKVALIALVATVVESIPTTEVIDDNISVPLASMFLAYLSFRH